MANDARFTVDVDAETSDAEAQIDSAFTEAIAGALNDPKVKAAFAAFIKTLTDSLQTVAKDFSDSFTQGTSDLKKTAESLSEIFEKVGDSAAKSAEEFGDNISSADKGVELLDRHIEAMTRNMDELASQSRDTASVLEQLTTSVNREAALRAQNLRTEQQESQALGRENTARLQKESAEIRRSGQVQAAAIRAFAQLSSQAMRSLTEVFRVVWRSAERFVRGFVNVAGQLIRGFVRGTGAALRGIGRAFQTAFRTAQRVVQTFARTALRAIQTFGRGILRTLTAPMRGIARLFNRQEREIRSSLRRSSGDMRRFAREGESSFRRLISSASRLAAVLGLGFGVTRAVSGFFRTFIGGGVGRLTAIEDATVQLRRMGLEFEQINFLLESVDQTFDGTPFANPEGFDISASLFASAIELERIPTILGTIADFAAHGNVPLDQMADVFVRIASQGKVTGEELNRLTDANIPLTSLAESLGLSVEEMLKLTKAGKFTSDMFFEGARGIEIFEGAAKALGDTTRGALANTLTAIRTLGEKFLEPIFGENGKVVNGLKNIQQRIKDLRPAFASFGEFIFGGRFDAETGFQPLSEFNERLASIRETVISVLATLGTFLGLSLGLRGAVFLLRTFARIVIALARPMNLLRLAFVGMAAGFGVLRQDFPFLDDMLGRIRNQFRPLLDAFGRLANVLGKAIPDAINEARGFFGRFLQVVVRVLQVIGRVLVGLRFFANTLADLIEVRGFADFGDSLDKAIGAGIGRLFGHGSEADAARARAEERGGSLILNMLEETFFGPVVTFLRDRVPDIASRIAGFFTFIIDKIREAVAGFAGFIGDIWGAIFGGDQQQARGGQGIGFRGVAARIVGDIEGESIGTRVLNVLDRTFLGPIVRFFRGPFARAMQSALGVALDIFRALRDTLGPFFVTGFQAVARGLTTAFNAVRDAVVNAWNTIRPLIQPMIDGFSNFFAIAREEGLGAAFSNLWGGIRTSVLNIWEGEDGQGGVKGALEGLWNTIVGWFRDTFTPENIAVIAPYILNALRQIGKFVGNIVSDPAFVIAVFAAAAAIATLIAAVVGSLIFGALEGLVSNAHDWAELIIAAVQSAVNLIPDFGIDVGPMTNAIITILSGAIGAAVGSLTLGRVVGRGRGAQIGGALGTGLGLILQGAIGDVNLDTLGLSFAGALGGALESPLFLGTLGVTLVSKFAPRFLRLLGGALSKHGATTVGGRGTGITAAIGRAMIPGANDPNVKAAGATVATRFLGAVRGGITRFAPLVLGATAGFGAGRALGESGAGLLEQLLGIAGLAGSLAFLSPKAGIAAAALGLVGLVIGNIGRAARETNEEIREFADELRGLPQLEQDVTAAQRILDDLLDPDRPENFGRAVIDAGFDVNQFVADIREGTAEADRTVLQLLRSAIEVSDHFAGLDPLGVGVLLGQLDVAAFEGDLTSVVQFVDGEIGRLETILADASLSINPPSPEETQAIAEQIQFLKDFRGALGDLKDEGFDVDQLLGILDGQIETTTGAFDRAALVAEALGVSITTVDDAVRELGAELAAASTAEEIMAILSPPRTTLTTPDQLEVIRQVAQEVESQVRSARDAVTELLTARIAPPTLEITEATVIVDIDRFNQQIESALEETNVELREANLTLAQANIADTVTAEINRAIEAGQIQTPADLTDAVNAIQVRAEGLDLSPQARTVIDDVLAEFLAAAEEEDFAAAMQKLVDNTAASEALKSAEEALGTTAADNVAAGFAKGEQGIRDAVGTSVVDVMRDQVEKRGLSLQGAGTVASESVATGIESSPAPANAAGQAALAAAGAAKLIGAIQFYLAGVSSAEGFARGLRDQVQQAANAAVAMANAVVAAARRNLRISSPSRVFVDIGRQIGQGFIQGIKDAEGDMSNALSEAISNAVENAIQRSRAAVSRAAAGETIFDLLAPALLPGGTPTAQISLSRIGLRSGINEFLPGLREGAAGLLGDLGQRPLQDAITAVRQIPLEFGDAMRSIRGDYREALEQQRAIAQFDAARNKIERDRQRGIIEWWERRDLLADLGQRPAALTFQQQQLLRTGAASLQLGTLAGSANREAFLESLDSIRQWGQAAIEAGRPVRTVVAEMLRYRQSLIQQGTQFGLNRAALQRLADVAGISSLSLNRMANQLVTLNRNTTQGAQNAGALLEQLVSIRQFGAEMISAGVATSTALDNMRSLRNALVNQAVQFGFNRNQVEALVREVGLANTQLSDFVKQLRDFEKETARANAVAAQAAREAEARRREEELQAQIEAEAELFPQRIPRPSIEQFHLHLPHSDPEAVAAATVNRLALVGF